MEKRKGSSRANNPIGHVMHSVVDVFKARAKQQQAPAPKGPTCPLCNKPAGDGLLIGGAHFECYEADKEAKRRAG
jgi:hypothetical protein